MDFRLEGGLVVLCRVAVCDFYLNKAMREMKFNMKELLHFADCFLFPENPVL